MDRSGIAAALHNCAAAAADRIGTVGKENAHVPVLGIVTTAAEDDRREAQSEALVHAAENMASKCWKCRSSARRRHRLKPCVR